MISQWLCNDIQSLSPSERRALQLWLDALIEEDRRAETQARLDDLCALKRECQRKKRQRDRINPD